MAVEPGPNQSAFDPTRPPPSRSAPSRPAPPLPSSPTPSQPPLPSSPKKLKYSNELDSRIKTPETTFKSEEKPKRPFVERVMQNSKENFIQDRELPHAPCTTSSTRSATAKCGK